MLKIYRFSILEGTTILRIELVSSQSPFFIVKDLPPGARKETYLLNEFGGKKKTKK